MCDRDVIGTSSLFNVIRSVSTLTRMLTLILYYESRNRELQTRSLYECRYDERLKTKDEKSTHLGYTGWIGELEHLKIKTRLIDEMLTSVMGEYVAER